MFVFDRLTSCVTIELLRIASIAPPRRVPNKISTARSLSVQNCSLYLIKLQTAWIAVTAVLFPHLYPANTVITTDYESRLWRWEIDYAYFVLAVDERNAENMAETNCKLYHILRFNGQISFENYQLWKRQI